MVTLRPQPSILVHTNSRTVRNTNAGFHVADQIILVKKCIQGHAHCVSSLLIWYTTVLNVPGSCEESVSVSMGLPVVYMSLGMYLPWYGGWDIWNTSNHIGTVGTSIEPCSWWHIAHITLRNNNWSFRYLTCKQVSNSL